jgi:hypothetical protein
MFENKVKKITPRGGSRIAQWYNAGLRDGWSAVRFPRGSGKFSLHYLVQNGSGDHAPSYPMGTRGSFLGGKAAEASS